ncbi:MAG: AAA family ATPase, partial [Okeania sp. SIO3C4]|nr:AAA family ATPase [Okeania sp. SIO3C4]
MFTKIELENFKCFREKTVFPLGQLTLLTGINGRGKSSLLQSLLLMRQSIEYDNRTNKLILNGKCLNLGRFDEIRNTGTSREKPIYFNYFYNHTIVNQAETLTTQGSVNYSFVEDMNDDLVAALTEVEIKGNTFSSSTNNSTPYHQVLKDAPTILGFLPDWSKFVSIDYLYELFQDDPTILEFTLEWLNFSAIHYISADRIGPQDFYLRSTLPKFPNVGLKGEQTVNLLHRMKDELINDKLYLGEDAQTLIIQTQEWLNKIFDGAKVEVFGSQTNILELMLNSSLSKDRFRPANIGFGYHCILPIIVSGLIAKKGEILIVENPEAHLHPKAQSELAKFLAKVSSCGIQVLIESHSDHILNALRIAVLDKILSNEELSILYFSQKIGES